MNKKTTVGDVVGVVFLAILGVIVALATIISFRRERAAERLRREAEVENRIEQLQAEAKAAKRDAEQARDALRKAQRRQEEAA